MSAASKTVSVVIPCRNEERFIERCLDSLLAQTYPKDQIEILAVNGASEDDTEKIVAAYAATHPSVKLLQNPKKFTPISMNVGIKNARGGFILLAGAHSSFAPDYIEKCVSHLERHNADVVGGTLETKPSRNTLAAQAIAEVLKSRLGTGGSSFRVGTSSVREVDTAFNACYRRELFEKVGLINEHLRRSQDMEFSMRIKRAGGKIILAPDISTTYYPKATLHEFWSHNISDGIWAILPVKYGARLFKLRHLAPFVFVLGLLGTGTAALLYRPLLVLPLAIAAPYLSVIAGVSLTLAVRAKRPTLFPFLIAAFAIRHFGYGIGSLMGFLKLLLPERRS